MRISYLGNIPSEGHLCTPLRTEYTDDKFLLSFLLEGHFRQKYILSLVVLSTVLLTKTLA